MLINYKLLCLIQTISRQTKKSVSGTPVTVAVSKRQSSCPGIFKPLDIKEVNLPWKLMIIHELKGFKIAKEEQTSVDTISIVTHVES